MKLIIVSMNKYIALKWHLCVSTEALPYIVTGKVLSLPYSCRRNKKGDRDKALSVILKVRPVWYSLLDSPLTHKEDQVNDFSHDVFSRKVAKKQLLIWR